MSKNNLIFALTKSCEDLIRASPEAAAITMANLISAMAAIKMRYAFDKDKVEAGVAVTIVDLMETCELLVGDALANHPS